MNTSPNESAVMLAFKVLQGWMLTLRAEDINDVATLIPLMCCDVDEERESAMKAIAEIIANPSGRVVRMSFTRELE